MQKTHIPNQLGRSSLRAKLQWLPKENRMAWRSPRAPSNFRARTQSSGHPDFTLCLPTSAIHSRCRFSISWQKKNVQIYKVRDSCVSHDLKLQSFLRLHHLLLEPLPSVPCNSYCHSLSWKFSLMAIATITHNFLGILGCSISCSGYKGRLTAGKLPKERHLTGESCRVTCVFFSLQSVLYSHVRSGWK